MDISLTTFADFAAAAGAAKVTVVKTAKNRYQAPFDPAADYWKFFREELVAILRSGRPASDLDQLVPNLTDKKKVRNYTTAVAGAQK
jgi:hypothetical protein